MRPGTLIILGVILLTYLVTLAPVRALSPQSNFDLASVVSQLQKMTEATNECVDDCQSSFQASVQILQANAGLKVVVSDMNGADQSEESSALIVANKMYHTLFAKVLGNVNISNFDQQYPYILEPIYVPYVPLVPPPVPS